MKLNTITLILGLFMFFTVSPSYANNDTLKDLIKIMHQNGQLSDQQFEMLSQGFKTEAKVDQPPRQPIAEEQQVSQKTSKKIDPPAEEKTQHVAVFDTNGKFKFESQDGQHSIQPIGRIFWDLISSDEDGSPDIAEGTELRRARFGFQAQFFKYWQGKMEIEFDSGDVELKDGWISYNNKLSSGDKYNIKVGQHHVPFGFTTINSSKVMSFIRRPLFADGPLSPSRQVGAAFRLDGDRYLLHTGIYQEESEAGVANIDGDGPLTYALRVAGTPYYEDKKHLFHLGGSYMHIDNRDNTFRVRQRAISHLDNRIFNTGTFAAGVIDNVNAYDLEAAAIYGPLYFLGEYVYWDLDNSGTGADKLSGWAVQTGWFLTGESMKYKKGQFSGVSPKSTLGNGGIGSWQAVMRYENMDLNDGTTIGGDGDVLSLGLIWSPIKNIRVLATYNKLIDFSRAGNINDGIEPSALSLRGLVYW